MGEVFTNSINNYSDKNAYATLNTETKEWEFMTYKEAG